MSLATRCSACGTVFRVVEDQLKISEGWVRCGRCKDVFNALESLFDLEREAPPEWRPRPVSSSAGATGAEASPFTMPPGTPAPERAIRPPPIQPAEPPPRSSFDEPVDGGDEPLLEPSWAVSRLSPTAASEDDPEAAGFPHSDGSPAFLRHPSTRSPRRLAALHGPGASALLALTLLLGGQIAYYSRNALAADWPMTRPLLAQACAWTGCRIEAPRRIEDIAVESSTLVQAGTNPASDLMRLSVVLRNRGTVALAMPTIDLSVTDTSGQLVARRALSSSDFGSASNTLPPTVETSLQLLVSTGGRRVSGYTVEALYP